MAKKCALASRAWNLLRLALIWARKGGLFKRGFLGNLRILSGSFRRLGVFDSNPYGEHEFSFDETPIFKLKLHKPCKQARYLPCIPCINPHIDFHDYGDDGGYCRDGDGSCGGGDDVDGIKPGVLIEDEEIDSKAEEFIARFYGQMKLQPQVLYLQYNEVLRTGTN